MIVSWELAEALVQFYTADRNWRLRYAEPTPPTDGEVELLAVAVDAAFHRVRSLFPLPGDDVFDDGPPSN